MQVAPLAGAPIGLVWSSYKLKREPGKCESYRESSSISVHMLRILEILHFYTENLAISQEIIFSRSMTVEVRGDLPFLEDAK